MAGNIWYKRSGSLAELSNCQREGDRVGERKERKEVCARYEIDKVNSNSFGMGTRDAASWDWDGDGFGGVNFR